MHLAVQGLYDTVLEILCKPDLEAFRPYRLDIWRQLTSLLKSSAKNQLVIVPADIIGAATEECKIIRVSRRSIYLFFPLPTDCIFTVSLSDILQGDEQSNQRVCARPGSTPV